MRFQTLAFTVTGPFLQTRQFFDSQFMYPFTKRGSLHILAFPSNAELVISLGREKKTRLIIRSYFCSSNFISKLLLLHFVKLIFLLFSRALLFLLFSSTFVYRHWVAYFGAMTKRVFQGARVFTHLVDFFKKWFLYLLAPP